MAGRAGKTAFELSLQVRLIGKSRVLRGFGDTGTLL